MLLYTDVKIPRQQLLVSFREKRFSLITTTQQTKAGHSIHIYMLAVIFQNRHLFPYNWNFLEIQSMQAEKSKQPSPFETLVKLFETEARWINFFSLKCWLNLKFASIMAAKRKSPQSIVKNKLKNTYASKPNAK